MFKDKRETVYQQWGGSTATYFAYTHFSHDLSAGLLAALLPHIRIGLKLNYFQSGLLLSAYTITSGLSQFPGGWLGDRVRRRTVIAIGLGGIGISSMIVGLSPSYYAMLAILVIMGIFAGGYHPSAVSVLSGHFDVDKRGKVIAIHMVGGSVGYALGPVLGGLIAEFTGWRLAFILMGIPAVVAVPLILKKFRQSIPDENGGEYATKSTDDLSGYRPKRRKPSILSVLKPVAIVTGLSILTQFIGGTALAFIPIYLVDKHGVVPTMAALLVGVTRGGGILGSVLGGWLSDRWGRKQTIFLGLTTIGPALYLLTRLQYNAWLITVMVLFGMLMYMRSATVQPFLMDSVPSQMRATVFGIYFGLSMEGMSFLQPVAGFFMDKFGIAAVFDVVALSSVALSVLALFLIKKVKVPVAAR